MTWGGREFTPEQLTGDHAALIVHGLGADTWDLSPLSGVVHFVAVLGAFVAVAEGRPYASVGRGLRSAPLSALTDALTFPD